MKLFLALLTLYLLAPGAANAGVVTSIVALVANGATIGAALTATLGTFGAFLVKAAAYVAFSLASQLLQPQRKVNIAGIQTEQTTTGDVTPLKFVVGRYGLEGHLVAPAYSHGGQNGKLNYILEVSNLPIEGIARVAVDGKWYEIDTDPENAHEEYGMPLAGLEIHNQSAAWIKIYDGTQTEADPMLVDKYGDHPDRPWTEDHILTGTAYVVMTFQYRERLFTGLPAVRFEVDGIKLYDPRKDTTVGGSGPHRWNSTATWEFTRNPQVIAYNVLRGITLPTGDIWGGQIPAEDLPLDAWFAAMNECDELIGSRVKYQAGFEIDVSAEPFEIIRELNKASFTQLSQFGGVFRPRTGGPGSSVMSITDGDILITEPSELDPFPSIDKTHNAVTGTFVDPGSIYQGRACDPIYNAEWEAEDGARRLTLDAGLPAVVNKSQAQHLLDSLINDDRRFRVHKIPLPPSAAVLEPLDAISWDSERNGYTSKVFEVVEVEDRLDSFVQIVTIRERDSGDVDWSTDDDVPDPAPYGGVTDPEDLVPTITLSPAEVEDATGTPRRPGITLSWPVDDDLELDLLRYEIRLSASEERITGGVADAREGQETHTAALIPNENYDVRAQYIQPGYPTDWCDWESVTTPDVRLSEDDLGDEVRDKINDARDLAEEASDRHDAALDEATGVIAELRGRIEVAFGPIDIPDLPTIPLVDATAAAEADRTAALDDLAGALTSLNMRLGELDGRVTSAGIFVDPATGRAGIEANGLTGEARLLVDGLAGEISARATYADVDEAIALAAFDPSQIADLEGIYVRLSTAETTISAQDAAITSLTETLTVDDGLVTMTTVTQELNSLEASLSTKVEQVALDDLADRVTVAEQGLEAEEGARFLTTLRDVATLREDREAAVYESLEQYLDNLAGLTAAEQSIALARQDMWARAEETDEAVAGLRLDLVAQTNSNAAAIQQEAIARASAVAAQAYETTQVQSNIDEVSSDLSTNYYTAAEVDGEVSSAVSAAQTVLQGNIDNVSATLAQDYYTSAETDGEISSAVSAAQTTLQSNIDGNTSTIEDLASTRVTAEGAVAAVDSVVGAEFGGLSTLAEFAQWAIANEDGTNSGYRFNLGGDDVISAVRVQPNGNTDPNTTIRLAGDHVILDGNTSVFGSFYTDVLQAAEAWITSAMVDELSADVIRIDNVVLDTDGNGNLTVRQGGIGRNQLDSGAATDFVDDTHAWGYLTTNGGTWAPALNIYLGAVALGDVWYMCGSGQGRSDVNVQGGIQVRRRVKIDGVWSNFTTLSRTVSDEFSSGWAAFNFFDLLGGVYEDVHYQMRTRANYGSVPAHTHRHLSLSARKNER